MLTEKSYVVQKSFQRGQDEMSDNLFLVFKGPTQDCIQEFNDGERRCSNQRNQYKRGKNGSGNPLGLYSSR